MCGICGVRRFGEEPITADQISALLLANQNRGNHATGLAIQNPNEEIHVLKTNEPAWEFISSKEYKAFVKEHLTELTYTVIGHTRAATQGDPKDNKNNHPLYAGTTAVVHNGMIHNDHTLFTSMSLKRNGDVDSDIIRAILDKRGLTREGARDLVKMSGSAAIAAISNEFPGRLMLARSGNPICMAATDHQLVWSSEKNAIHYAMRPFVKKHGVWMQEGKADHLAWVTMNNNSAYLFNEDGLEWHEEWNVCYTFTPKEYEVNKTYPNHRSRYYSDGKTDVVLCPNVACGRFLPLSKEQQKKPLWALICGNCKTKLAPEPAGKEVN